MAAGIFIRKLEMFERLPDHDRVFLFDSLSRTRTIPANTDLAVEGDKPGDLHVVLDGVACRYKKLSNGLRQITSVVLPGDFVDLHALVLRRMDHSVRCLRKSVVAVISQQRLREMTERPAIARSMIFAGLVDEAVQREWTANVGQRAASEWMAHLLCELFFRMQFVGLVQNDNLPITQTELADMLGLSLVHTNKSLKKLKDRHLVVYRQGVMTVLDIEALRVFSGFEAAYLHLTGGISASERNDP